VKSKYCGGDRVRIVDSKTVYYNQTGKIVELKELGCIVKIDCGNPIYYIYPSVELVDDAFVIGNRVEICAPKNLHHGEHGIIKSLRLHTAEVLIVNTLAPRIFPRNDVKPVQAFTKPDHNQSKPMNILERYRTSRMKEPEKTLTKAKLMNDGMLNHSGNILFIAFLVDKYGEEFKKEVVDPILAEANKTK